MNKSIVVHYLSKIMLVGSILFVFPALISLYYREMNTALTFLIVAAGTAVVSLPCSVIKPKSNQMYAREGQAIAALLWVLFPLAGAFPFYISGEIPSFCDALFESISGFTTTGSTILVDIESLSKGMIFWRSFTHWVGGMGVLVLAIAILPSSGNTLHLMRGECAGPQVGKIVPKGKNSAAYLYIIYTALTVVTFILLLLGDMPVFDSACHAMGIAGTGGFGIKNTGIAYYNSAYIEAVITITMFLFGINFSLYYFMLIKRFREVRKNTELKAYIMIAGTATVLIMLNIHSVYGSWTKCLRYAAFQVSSILTSTGFATADFNYWPTFSQMILVLLMFIGACAGSTGGGFKVQRFVIMFKSAGKFIKRIIHPKSVIVVKSDDKTMDIDTVHGVHNYLIIYIGIFIFSIILVSLNNADFATTFSAVATCINNIGPGLSKAGPMENFAFFSDFSKYVLSADMLLGRLECLPLLILCSPSVWRRNF